MNVNGTDGADFLDWTSLNLQDWDWIFGLGGDDIINVSTGTAIGGPGNDTITGSTLNSTAAYWGSSAGINADLSLGRIKDGLGGVDIVFGIYSIQGTQYNDRFIGSSNNETFWSNGGSDIYYGSGGHDTVSYYNLISTDIGYWYDSMDGALVVKKVSNGVESIDRLYDVESILFLGPKSSNERLWTRSLIENITANDSTRYTLSEANISLSVGGYSVQNNVWPDGTEYNNLIIDKDYWQNIDFARSEIQSDVLMKWSYPEAPPPNYVYAFPTLAWGAGENLLVNGAKSYRLDELKGLSVTYDYNISGNTNKFNVALELYTWSKPVTTEGVVKKSEIMVKLYQPWSDGENFSYKDQYINASVAIKLDQAGARTPQDGLSEWTYASFQLKTASYQGMVDYSRIFDYLISKGLISASDYVAGLSIGAEIIGGSGSLSINEFNVNASTINNDNLFASKNSAVINGDNGTDVVHFKQSFNDYKLTVSENLVIASSKDGFSNQLINCERLEFVDCGVAFDVLGGAGIVAKVIGSVFGVNSIKNKEYVGVGLKLMDDGMSYHDLADLVLKAKLGTSFDNEKVVELLYYNIVGHAPSNFERINYVSLLNNGTYTPASLGVMAAETTLNAENIDLIGLSQSGIIYSLI